MDRRKLLQSGLAAGALVALPAPALAQPLGTALGSGPGAQRRSQLFRGHRLVHADLHNHSHLSDGTGDPARIHQMLREAGIDIAALTDHSVAAFGRRDFCAADPDVEGEQNPCRSLFGLSDQGWQTTRDLAAAADAPGRYAALPGFEWSSPHLGHMNVWFSEDWIDPLQTGGITVAGLAQIGLSIDLLEQMLRDQFGHLLSDAEIVELVTSILDQDDSGMRRFYDWLLHQPGTGDLGGGAGALTGFNHPNREPSVFDDFAFDERVADRMVTLELFNRREDYLFKNLDAGMPSPLVACLNAGWQVGLAGATDEHGTSWGSEEGKGRTGVWLRSLNRRAVRTALLSRRVFATREAGLRLAATADAVPMGGTLHPRRRPVQFAVDLDLGPAQAGMPVTVQVLRPGHEVPEVVDVVPARTASADDPPLTFSVTLDPDDGDWVVLRISDPERPNDSPAPFDHPCNDYGLAYASPWWFVPGARHPGRGRGRPGGWRPGRQPVTLPPRRRLVPDEPAWWNHDH